MLEFPRRRCRHISCRLYATAVGLIEFSRYWKSLCQPPKATRSTFRVADYRVIQKAFTAQSRCRYDMSSTFRWGEAPILPPPLGFRRWWLKEYHQTYYTTIPMPYLKSWISLTSIALSHAMTSMRAPFERSAQLWWNIYTLFGKVATDDRAYWKSLRLSYSLSTIRRISILTTISMKMLVLRRLQIFMPSPHLPTPRTFTLLLFDKLPRHMTKHWDSMIYWLMIDFIALIGISRRLQIPRNNARRASHLSVLILRASLFSKYYTSYMHLRHIAFAHIGACHGFEMFEDAIHIDYMFL